jgi:hypothetical protein
VFADVRLYPTLCVSRARSCVFVCAIVLFAACNRGGRLPLFNAVCMKSKIVCVCTLCIGRARLCVFVCAIVLFAACNHTFILCAM